MGVPRYRRVAPNRATLGNRDSSLLVRAIRFERRTLARSREARRPAGCRDAKVCLWAFDAVLHLLVRWLLLLLLPGTWALVDIRGCGTSPRLSWLWLGGPRSANGVDSRPRGRRDANAVGIVLKAAFYTVAWWEEGIEALDEVRVAGEELRNSTNNTRSIDTKRGSAACPSAQVCPVNSRLALEVFHDI